MMSTSKTQFQHIQVVNDILGNLEAKIVSMDDSLGNFEKTVELSTKAIKSVRTELKTEIESVKEAFDEKLEHLDESIATTIRPCRAKLKT